MESIYVGYDPMIDGDLYKIGKHHNTNLREIVEQYRRTRPLFYIIRGYECKKASVIESYIIKNLKPFKLLRADNLDINTSKCEWFFVSIEEIDKVICSAFKSTGENFPFSPLSYESERTYMDYKTVKEQSLFLNYTTTEVGSNSEFEWI